MKTLKNLIKQIYYFGSSKDGFNTFPESNAFAHYYTNSAPEKWLLTLRKVNSVVYHTFVKYGLMTSFKDGRTGSHIGISIAMNDYYFNDLKFLSKNFFQEIINIMRKEEKLIEGKGTYIRPFKDDECDNIAFVPLGLSDVKDYLERWNAEIKNYFTEKEVTKYLKKLSPNIPGCDEFFYKLHVNNKKEIIQRYFEKSGAVNVADHEKYPIVSK